ncbi:MAG: PSP1 domain-containing protein [Candidatus Saganbacteria bacterium]|uniref:PSP1 domain-containing protein n=1 Tax=Candidatus Saganbacteria bacterium TaxID=2575572 RepID=A0A833L1N6_UNCSA|nr:MAG: PSP1 domain-containing protein [Candidatus Saganbacteria bacterium]
MEPKLAIKLRKFNRICPIAGYKEDAIKVGAAVIVLTDRGEEFGTIVSFPNKYPKILSQDVRLKKVIRYATENDIKIANSLGGMEEEAKIFAAKKAKEYEFQLKIIGVEYLFDIKKANIYYKIEKDKKTPDLKSYRRDLSSSLKAEITMRSITPRDEAKYLGGLGPCGKALCCAKWLDKPRHITVKMVKEQGFQISPLRTSGMCGRLMCCFGYEEDHKGA